jgi:hypothetical protein
MLNCVSSNTLYPHYPAVINALPKFLKANIDKKAKLTTVILYLKRFNYIFNISEMVNDKKDFTFNFYLIFYSFFIR